jgi:hypothetical protein
LAIARETFWQWALPERRGRRRVGTGASRRIQVRKLRAVVVAVVEEPGWNALLRVWPVLVEAGGHGQLQLGL